MAVKSTITHQYDLSVEVIGIVALPEERSIALSWNQDSGYLHLDLGVYFPIVLLRIRSQIVTFKHISSLNLFQWML